MPDLASIPAMVVDTKRYIKTSNAFPKPTKIALLNFIGLNDYFITEWGGVWNNNRVYKNKLGLITKGYLPSTILDFEFPYPWVLLPLSPVSCWMPVNQLLGWAFFQPKDTDRRFFLSSHPEDTVLNIETFAWTKEMPLHRADSRYLKFLDATYVLQK